MSELSSLGAYLRELRRRRGVSIDEVARATRISPQYLEAMERDDLSTLPAPVFSRGFIRAYCQFVGEPPDEALRLYEAGAGAPGGPAPVVAPRASAFSAQSTRDADAQSRSTVLASFVLLVILGLALFAVTLVLQSGRADRRPVGVASAPAPTAMPVGGEPAPAPPTPRTGPAAAPAAPPASPALPLVATATTPYRLVARATQPTWLRVRTEEGRTTEETIPAGEVREWTSNGPFVLTVGNAGGVTLELNGRPLPPLGTSGTVIPRLVIPSPHQ